MNNPNVQKMAQIAKALAFQMSAASLQQRNKALEELIKNIQQNQDIILAANAQDVTHAQEQGLNEALIERLSLANRLKDIIYDITQVLNLPDPLGEKFEEHQNFSNKLHFTKCRVPLGVLGVIYESRPNVTLDISALTIKSGNCALLRGGSETLNTNKMLIQIIQASLEAANLPQKAIQLIASPDRLQVKQLLQLHDSIDLIIPRGSEALQEFCRKNSTIPVITGGIGICHIFVDESADLKRSLQIIINAKTQRPNVCNALDTLLVHASIASSFIPRVIETLSKKKVSFRLDPLAKTLVNNDSCQLAQANDWDTEWLNLTLGIKVVTDLKEAIDHIHKHSTGHSDGILTENSLHAEIFTRKIDSAAVYVNASTRFTDGGQFGLGSEVAISTQKLHARGPMGLKELTSYKWIIQGDYQIRN